MNMLLFMDLQHLIWRQHVPSKHQEPFLQNHCVTPQETGILESNTSFAWKMKALWLFKTTGTNNAVSQHHIPRWLTSKLTWITIFVTVSVISLPTIYMHFANFKSSRQGLHFIFRVLGSNRSSKTYHDRMFSLSTHMSGQHSWDVADDGCHIN
jgi:hypothetical protein